MKKGEFSMRSITHQGWSQLDQLYGIIAGVAWLALTILVKFPGAALLPVIYITALFAAIEIKRRMEGELDFSIFWNTPYTLAITLANIIIAFTGAGVYLIVHSIAG